LLYP